MADKKEVLKPALWTPRPVEETIAVYTDWAANYDANVSARGYRTPARLAEALAQFLPNDAALLDFGCGTGISGAALRKAGFTTIDGTDVTAAMLEKAQARGIYRNCWLSQPDEMSFETGAYAAITAIGVISLGAAPASILAPLLAKLSTGGLMAFSYNQPTLSDESYAAAIDAEVSAGHAEVVFRENGPHLEDVEMSSDVIILRRK